MATFNNTSMNANEPNSQLSLEGCSFTDSVAVQICKVLAYCAVLLTSLIGNTLLIIVIYKRKDLRKTVNYFIVNMAFSDFVFSLSGIPVELTQMLSNSFQWHVSGTAGSILCKAYRFSTVTSLTVSVQSIGRITVDRFIAVMFPMTSRIISPKYRVIAIASTWVLALAVRTPLMMTMNLEKYKNLTYCGHWDIVVVFGNMTVFTSYSVATEVIFLIFPLSLITILYFVIAVTLKRRIKHLAQISSHVQREACSESARAAKMSFFMMLAYGICFIPYMAYSYGIYKNGFFSCSLHRILLFFDVFMLYFSSTVNPIICFSFVRKFRLEVIKMYNKCSKKSADSNGEITGQHEIVVLKSIKLIKVND